MKKISVLLIAFLILGATSLSATVTRDAGMGLSEVPWMLDGLQGNVYLNPAYAADFKNRVFFDRTGFANGLNSGGMFWNPVAGLTIGLVSGIAVSNALWNTSSAQGLYYQGNYSSNVGGYSTANNFDVATIDGDEFSLIDPDPSDEDYKKVDLEQQAFRIFTAYDFGKISAGLSFGFASGWNEDSYDYDSTTDVDDKKDSYTLSEVQYDVVLGGAFKLTDSMDLSADVTFKYYDLENIYDIQSGTTLNKTYNLNYKGSGAMDILAGVGYNIKVGSIQKIHTRVQYGFLNRSTEASITATLPASKTISEDYQRLGHEVRLGVSDEMSISKNLTLFVGINAVYSLFTYKAVAISGDGDGDIDNDRYNADASTVQIPFYVGLELKPHKNFEFRIGLSHVIYNLTMIDSSFIDASASADDVTKEWSETINNSNTTEMAMGLTWKFYNVRLDWVLNVDIFTRGPDFISGYASSKGVIEDGSTPLATSFAVSYDFNSLWNKVAGE